MCFLLVKSCFVVIYSCFSLLKEQCHEIVNLFLLKRFDWAPFEQAKNLVSALSLTTRTPDFSMRYGDFHIFKLLLRWHRVRVANDYADTLITLIVMSKGRAVSQQSQGSLWAYITLMVSVVVDYADTSVSIVVDYADTRFLRISLQKRKSSRNCFFRLIWGTVPIF